jgi:prefoldin subunit 2
VRAHSRLPTLPTTAFEDHADLQSLHRTTEAAQLFQSRRSELQGIASKVGELEGEADEHK